MKECGKCKTEKSREEFSRNKRKRDGLQNWCKTCSIQKDSKYLQRASKVVDSKKCATCGARKPKEEFPPNKNVSDGLQSYCRSCKKKSYVRKPRQKTDNLSKVQQSLLEITETTTKQCSKCEEHKLLDGFGRRKDGLYGRQNWCKACRKVYDAQRQEARFDHIQKVQQKWKAENREKVVEQRKKYRHTPEGREAIKRSEAKRRALEYDAFIEDIPQSFIDILLSRQNNYCRYCLLDFNLEPFYTVEHIVPLTRGGKEEKLNIQLVCGSCNSSKLTKTHEEFLVYLRQGLGPKFLRWAK